MSGGSRGAAINMSKSPYSLGSPFAYGHGHLPMHLPMYAFSPQHGASAGLHSPTPTYSPRSKATMKCNNNLETCRDIVDEMAEVGVISFVNEKPTCVNPLGLVSRTVKGVLEDRLVFDGSRWVNLHVKPPHVKLSHVEKVLQTMRKDDFMATFDLKSAYYQIRMHKDSVTFLGASLQYPEGPCYFVYNYLPFGLNTAVHVITKLWKLILGYLHKCGIRFSIYIDDGIIIAASKDQLHQDLDTVYDVVQKAGWQISWDKSDKVEQISQSKAYLGLLCPIGPSIGGSLFDRGCLQERKISN